MTEAQQCPHCGAALGPDAPLGLCPDCLLKQGKITKSVSPGRAGTPPPPPEDLARHFPQLEILDLLGQGGMGAVYKTRQPKLDRIVALKILSPDLGKDPEFAERFSREARALARLNHPNIIDVYDFGEADGFYYFIMEFVDGVNLRELIRSGRLEPRQALAIVPQICDALHYAHDEGIIHRDIKPENILVDERGRVKMADFGLAKLLGRGQKPFTLTGTQQVMGTIHYMAPEQMEKPREVDHRADIFSLGVVFYELLTGELPLGRFDPPSRKVEVDVRLDEVVLRALEKEPGRRYQSAGELKSNVESVSTAIPESVAAAERPVSGTESPPVEKLQELEALGMSVAPARPRFSLLPIFGALWIPLGIMVPLAYFLVMPVPAHQGEELPSGFTILQVVLIGLSILGVLSPFGSTALGWMGISKIKNSGGTLIGLPLALGVALFYPLLILDWILCTACAFLVGPMVENVAAIVISILILLTIALDIYILWLSWRALTKPAAERRGEVGRAFGWSFLVLGIFLVIMTLMGMVNAFDRGATDPAYLTHEIFRSLFSSTVGVPAFVTGLVLLMVFRKSKTSRMGSPADPAVQ